MEPCALGGDKLKRIMRWTNWHREAENKMRLIGITDNVQRLNCLRRWAGEELTKIWEKEECMEVETNREGEGAVSAHTYERVVEGTMMTLLSDAWSMQVTLLKQEGDSERDCDKNTTTAANDKGNGEEGANQDGDRAAGSSQDIVEDTYEAEGARKSRARTRPTNSRPRPRTS